MNDSHEDQKIRRKTKGIVALLVYALILTASGFGADEEDRAGQVRSDDDVTVLAIGDSIVEWNAAEGQSIPDVYAQFLC